MASTRQIRGQDLVNLINLTDREILYRLESPSFGFQKLLKRGLYLSNDKTFDYDRFENLMEISGRACAVEGFREKVQNFASVLAECDKFLFVDTFDVLNDCINTLKTSDSEKKKQLKYKLPLLVNHYIIILKTLMKGNFSCTEKIVDYGFPRLQNILNVMRNKKIKVLDETTQEYNKLKRCIDRYTRASPSSEVDDIDEMTIMPEENDIINVTIYDLPCNIIDAPYRSVRHYLSVHFQLTREDMLRSFRDCVKVVANPDESYKLKCNLYDCVRITSSPVFTADGIFFNINITTIKVTDWLKKDVLLPGSLVCLTLDNFQSVIFASVAEIKSTSGKSKSANGKIKLVRFDDKKLEKGVDYKMIEPSAYFECYKHVLTAIKTFSENNFPLADFLVFFNYENPTPKYLTHQEDENELNESLGNKRKDSETKPEYCLHENVCDEDFYKLFLNEKNPSFLETEISTASTDKLEGKEDLPSGKRFNPLSFDEWPTAKELKLDEQQHKAFVTALTNKVAVIQGPPGTGKTFIGVKVVNALLLNAPLVPITPFGRKVTPGKGRVPIIVCCLTNHALDQFLERIYKYNKNVVRLGSQSQSTILEANTLDNLIYAYREFKKYSTKNLNLEGTLKKSLNHLKNFVPEILDLQSSDSSLDQGRLNLQSICYDLQSKQLQLDLCNYKYLEDSALNQIIDSMYKLQLRSKSSTDSKTLSASVMEWLTCSQSNALLETCEKKFSAYLKINCEIDLKPKNVWHINLEDRYKLFYGWRKKCLEILEKNIDALKQEYQKLMEECSDPMPDLVKLEILAKSRVIGVTTTGAGKYRSLLKECSPRILVIEEAAEVLESHTIASLLPSIEHLILIGDHMQLRPLPADNELGKEYNLSISMFERLFTNNCPSETLVAQHRMKPYIAELLIQDELYSDLTSYENVYKYEDIKDVKYSMFFFNHSNPEKEMSSSTSCSNPFEAQMIASFAQYLCKKNYTSDQITIIATYNAQLPLIESYLKEGNLDVKVTTVDNYQGEENDIVLVSFVRNNGSGIIGFLRENNRVCVALSRARKGMFCFGNFTLYAEKSKLWKSIIEKVEAKGMIGDKLPLMCSQHGKVIEVNSPDQVLEFSNYGCNEKCGFKLVCTHVCQRKCHWDDTDHLKYRCPLPCEKFICEGKKCPRLCYERCKRDKKNKVFLDCGHLARQRNDGSLALCYEEVQKVLPCMHIDTVPCSTDLSKHKCKASVSVCLPCGHMKNRECYRANDIKFVKCDKEIPVTGPCNHTISIPCTLTYSDENELLAYCKNACGKLLKCGHPCVGSCHWCLDYGIHSNCVEACKLILNCGHVCGGLCGSPCPPCEKRCAMSCFHKAGTCQKDDCIVPNDGLCIHTFSKTQCINQCARPCSRCEKNCELKCKHGRCSKKCYEDCSVLPCSNICDFKLFCGHSCQGLCGDPCPFPCLKCDEKDSKFNLNTDRFVQLLDCQHIIEVNELNEHIEICLECFLWPNCPLCSKPIQNSLRYKMKLRRARDNVLAAYDSTEEINHVNYLWRSMYGTDFIVPAEFREVDRKISAILRKEKPSSGTLLVLSHCLKSLSELMSVKENLDENNDNSKKYRFENLLIWISHHLEKASYQQLDELETSIKALKL